MKRLLSTTLIALVSMTALAQSAQAGWFEKATGIRTPEPIRKIAPNGISYTPPKQAESYFYVHTDPYITADGKAYGGTSNSGQKPAYLGRASKIQSGNMLYWVYRQNGYNLSRKIGPAVVSRPQNVGPTPQQLQHQQRQRQQQLFYQQMQENNRRIQQSHQMIMNNLQRSLNQINSNYQQQPQPYRGW